MSVRVEVYTVGGIVTGEVPGAAVVLRDLLEAGEPLAMDAATWLPFDGPTVHGRGPSVVDPDDVLAATDDGPPPIPVHAVWHPINLELGPLRISGELPTLPGFDPGRALTRPSGSFVLLREARVDLIGRPDAGTIVHEHILVNRYAVDRLRSDLVLAFFFPGARLETAGGAPAA